MLFMPKKELIAWLTWLAPVIWTALVGGSLLWTVQNDKNETMNTAYAEARATLNKDITLRRWVTGHGGVYVPMTDNQPSVPWLSHVPGRDVTTVDGRRLTLLNPASVVRQIMDRYSEEYGVRGRITGLKYLNPGNAPDPWEKLQLEAFVRKEKAEVWEIAEIDGQPYLRHLRAMVMEPGCETCHAVLGYKLGDIRGATGLNLPLADYYQQVSRHRRNLEFTHGAIWLVGLMGIGVSSRMLRRRERRLEEHNATFKKLFEQSSDAILLIDSTGVFVECNQAALKLLKMTREQFLLLPPSRISPEFQPDGRSSAEAAPEMIALAYSKGLHRFDWACINAEGREFIVEVSLMPIVVKGQMMLHTTWRDVTERKRMMEALEESQERYRALSEAASEAIFISEKGVCLEQNLRAEQMFGYTLAEAQGRLGTEWIAPEDREKVMQRMMSGFEEPYEAHGLRKDGSTFPAIIRGRMMHYRNRSVRVTSMSDITELKRAEAAVKAGEERWRFAVEGSGDGVWDWNLQTGAASFSKRWKEMLGFSEDEIASDSAEWSDRVHPDDLPGVMATIQAHLDGTTPSAVVEFRMRNKAGQWQWILGRGMVVGRDADGKPLRLVGTNSDISERKASADQIEHLAFYDPLTDLPNRRLLMDRLEQTLASSARHGRYGALMLLDMDDFKTLNDTLGHDVGDQFLLEVANRLLATVREGDTVARHGGDEFVLIVKDLSEDGTAAMQAESVAVKILRSVSQSYLLNLPDQLGSRNTRSYHCTSSIGITLFCDNSLSADELLKRADTAMYQAKAAGRNTLRFFDVGMQAIVTARAVLDNDLRAAVRQDQFCLYYQPQVDKGGNRTGAEALLRWRHPTRGMVSPVEFIAQAEASGLILPIGHWVLETACAQLAAWAGQPEKSHLTMAVNVSARQFHHVDFVEQVLAIVDSTGIDPTKLKLELTESLLLEDVDEIVFKMDQLKTEGIGFSLDDFGTGYSSLTYLKRLPLDQLKIDRSFVKDALTDSNDATIARTIVALAQSLGLNVIAEGVETEEQRAFLVSIGCLAYQGYLFGRPMPIEDFL